MDGRKSKNHSPITLCLAYITYATDRELRRWPSSPPTVQGLRPRRAAWVESCGRALHPQHSNESSQIARGDRSAGRTTDGGAFGYARGRRPWLGLVVRSRSKAHPRIRGLCHWAGEPGGRPGAESPSRRATEPASTRKTSPPRSRRSQGLFRARCASAMPRCFRAPPFASSRRSLIHVLVINWHWPEPPSFDDASTRSLATPTRAHFALPDVFRHT